MRSIDLMPYKTGDIADDGREQIFDIRVSLVACLFADDRIAPRELLSRDRLAKVIEEWDGDELLLEDADWDTIQRGLIVAAPSARANVEFVRRVLDAPTV